MARTLQSLAVLRTLRLAAALALLAPLGSAAQPGFDHRHARFTAFLEAHVTWFRDGHRSAVAYRAARPDHAALKAYLEAIAAVPRERFEDWREDEQLAFLLNTYNAAIIDRLLREDRLPESIRDLGGLFSPIWKEPFIALFGETVSLDHVEHDVIRARFDEPLIHAGLVCASCSCPPLRREAFVPGRLDAQLADSMARFLGDRGRNRVVPDRQRIEVSKIFDWFEEDFENARGEIRPFFAAWSQALADGEAEAELLAGGDYRIRHLPYDWSLNAPGNCPG